MVEVLGSRLLVEVVGCVMLSFEKEAEKGGRVHG